MGKRGQITNEIQKVVECNLKLGVSSISQMELRLIPYVQYCVVNNENIDPRKINAEERKILFTWRERGWIYGGASELEVSKIFWDAMSAILWLGYVKHD